MRELNFQEVTQVSGGFGLVGVGIGAMVGFGTSLASGSPSRIFAATILGGLSGATGNFAASVAAGGWAVRTAWGAKSVGLGISGGLIGSGAGSTGSGDSGGGGGSASPVEDDS